ncbi:Stress response protein nst1-like protein 2 [Pleurostoma richardsiae]|uniref:Stress response protein nst1-like protein 2 n=1 Tax=Pleurostoma richardsiae TaxID=41990 RepID=A0AA38RLZ2_9PEZI|nr:Stress response protein nst1-like protein 2 [Pleurostoma richardsiae]
MAQSPSPGRPSFHLDVPPPPYETVDPLSSEGRGVVYSQWQTSDPRASSSQSLAASDTGSEDKRRTLLVVFIHGYLGGEASFRSFPAHVHNYLKATLVDTHVIHTKIYPRYKTYRAIEVARDNFSAWLEPHESETTDVILAGHSMGGILAGDVVLMPSPNQVYGYPFRHRILGTISFDSPFLGLHPGIVVTGIASLFRKSPDPKEQPQEYAESPSLTANTSGSLSPDPSIYSEISPPSGVSSPYTLTATTSVSSSFDAPPSRPDPLFDPPFFNDVVFRDRGWMRNIAHFAKKHRAEGITNSAANHILNHLQFNSCLLDYSSLNSRYGRLRSLEDVDDFSSANGAAPQAAQVRFVNYYTLSTGRLKRPKVPSPVLSPAPTNPENDDAHASFVLDEKETPLPLGDDSSLSTPRISIEDPNSPGTPESNEMEDTQPMEDIEPIAMTDEEAAAEPPPTDPSPAPEEDDNDDISGLGDDLPAIPDPPEAPGLVDLGQYTDKAARKQAEKDAKRAQKAYEQALKARDKAIRDREKAVDKRRKKSLKEAAKRDKEALRRFQAEQRELSERTARMALSGESDPGTADSAPPGPPPPLPPREKQKKRKFCMLPRGVDGAWVPVAMEDMDEVQAHCALFMPGPHYEGFVGEVGDRIVRWVQEDASKRAVREMM